ncbi:MAG: LCP family protein [Spirochaetaceae bacterium]|nr:LCP family protein [Spirochaetaceae bacterium]
MRNKNTDLSILILVCIVFIVLVLTGGAAYYALSGNRASFSDTDNSLVISTVFIFEHDNKPLSTFVTLCYPATKRSAVFDIPGNIGRILKKIDRVDRIDTVYDGQSPDDFISEIENLLAIDISYLMIFDLPTLEKTVDLLDGVTVSIPQAITIYDGKDSILFPAGRTVLDGDKMREYISYENEEGDIELPRQRRERFFTGFLKRLSEKNSFLKKPELTAILNGLLRTNMSQRTRTELFDEFAKIDADRIAVQTIGGNFREVSGKQLLFPFYDGSLVKDIVRQTLAALTREGAFSSSGRVITVEILNGTNVAGLAGRTAELIRVFGYDVIKIGNATDGNYDKTEIIDHTRQKAEVQIFADIIRCENIKTDASEIGSENDMQTYEYKADLTLIIGKDFNGRFTKKS